MKKLLLVTILLLVFLLKPPMTFAQPMMGGSTEVTSDGHTAREEAEGKEIWEKLRAKQLECKNLTDDNFESLGEYFMGQMLAPSGAEGAGGSHEAMNNMMIRMMGEEGEKQMHIAMGKRNSGCDASAAFPQKRASFIPMMGYGGWGGFGFGWIFMIIFWVLVILVVFALFRYLSRSGQGKEDKTPLDILKERYAKGEIDKKEFEEMKKDLR